MLVRGHFLYLYPDTLWLYYLIFIMENWYSNYEKDVVHQLEGIKRRDLRFFRIEELLRMAELADKFASSCRECRSFCHQMEKDKESVGKAIREPGPERRELDRIQSQMSDHMRKSHGFYPPFYFTYLHSFIWTALLGALAYVTSLFFPNSDLWNFIAPAFAAGVIIGQVTGSRKDRRIRDSKKNL